MTNQVCKWCRVTEPIRRNTIIMALKRRAKMTMCNYKIMYKERNMTFTCFMGFRVYYLITGRGEWIRKYIKHTPTCAILKMKRKTHAHSVDFAQALRYKITWRMSGFVQQCVITKECPETFLLFLYKTPIFPRLVQVLRICFLSLPRLLRFPLSLCLWRHTDTHNG